MFGGDRQDFISAYCLQSISALCMHSHLFLMYNGEVPEAGWLVVLVCG